LVFRPSLEIQPLNTIDEMKACLDRELPFFCDVQFPPWFYGRETTRSGKAPPPSPAAEFCDHSVLIVGYNDDTREFIFQNSWGTQWGDHGFGYFPYEYITEGLFQSAYCWRGEPQKEPFAQYLLRKSRESVASASSLPTWEKQRRPNHYHDSWSHVNRLLSSSGSSSGSSSRRVSSSSSSSMLLSSDEDSNTSDSAGHVSTGGCGVEEGRLSHSAGSISVIDTSTAHAFALSSDGWARPVEDSGVLQ